MLCWIWSYLWYKQRLHMTLAERYPVCYEKITKAFDKLYRCELIQDKNTKDDCLQAIPDNELISTESWCEDIIDEINVMDCSEKYNKDSNGIRAYKCILDKLWYQPIGYT